MKACHNMIHQQMSQIFVFIIYYCKYEDFDSYRNLMVEFTDHDVDSKQK